MKRLSNLSARYCRINQELAHKEYYKWLRDNGLLSEQEGREFNEKIVVSIISFVLTKVVVDFIGMQLIKLFLLKDFDFKYIFDYSLLFLDGNKFFLLLSFLLF